MDTQPPQNENPNTEQTQPNSNFNYQASPASPEIPTQQLNQSSVVSPQYGNQLQPQIPQAVFAPVAQTEQKGNAVAIVLQWLSYGLWEWTLCALSILLSTTLTYYFVSSTRSNNYSWVAYVVATMIVLLPFAFVLDKMYSKKEPVHKHGFSAVVLVINAVIVFLAAIGGLIAMVVSGLSIILSASVSSTVYITIVSSLVVSSLGLLLFLRIMNFPKLHKFTKLFPIIIVVIAGLAAVLALAGPFRAEAAAKNDRLIEENLSSLNQSIQDYGRKNKKLPSALSELDLSTSSKHGAKALVDKNLVEYNKKTVGESDTDSDTYNTDDLQALSSKIRSKSTTKLPYELCVTYKKAKGGNNEIDYAGTTYIYTYSHKAGRQCYSQAVSLSSYDY